MRKYILFMFAALLTAVPAYCYEFHLLNGMVMKGDLTGFRDGRFLVKTDVGEMDVDAGTLDYIIVEEADGIAAKGAAPGMPVGSPDTQKGCEPVRIMAEAMPAPPEPPAPLSGHTLSAPVKGRTLLPPSPLNGWTLARPTDKQFYPGLFKGAGE